jgi:hypothetical protein
MVEILQAIQKEIIRTFIVKQLLSAVGGIDFSGGGGGGAFGLTDFDQQGFAEGGRTPVNQSFVVGEKGPEVLSFGRSGFVTPNDELGGGETTQIVLQVNTGVAQSVKAEMITLLPQINKTLQSAMADKRLRGGGFSKAMRG